MLPVSVRADVIYEPFDDFYMTNRESCAYVGRSYLTAGPNGTVTLYESPINPGVKKTYDNGITLYVSYTYQDEDGIHWACCDNWEDNITGWVPMEYLRLIYDEQSFYEEHIEQIVPVQVSLDSAELTGKTVYFWVYPGSSDYIEVEMSADYRPSFQESYTDENGAEWIRCGYFRGIKGKWVNLNQPTADYETLFPDIPPETEPASTVPAVTEQVDEIKPAPGGIVVIVIVAVAAVVAATAVLLILLKKKR
jgi:hypothetical protein